MAKKGRVAKKVEVGAETKLVTTEENAAPANAEGEKDVAPHMRTSKYDEAFRAERRAKKKERRRLAMEEKKVDREKGDDGAIAEEGGVLLKTRAKARWLRPTKARKARSAEKADSPSAQLE